MRTTDLEAGARAALARYGMLKPGDTVIAALSGGADSMALFHFLFTRKEELGIALEAAHVNHGLRAGADGDEAFVRQVCRRWGVPLHVRRLSPPAAGAGEAWARAGRYAFFEGLAAEKDAKVATAHTADDQAETVLLNLCRGAGVQGAAGIPPVRGPFIRPLLGVTRAQVAAYLEQNGVPHVEDETNASDDYARNRVRHTVLPALEAVHPGAAAALARFADAQRDAADYLNARAAALLDGARLAPGVWRAAPLRQAPPAVGRAAVRLAIAAAGAAPEKAALTGRAYRMLLDGRGAVDLGAAVLRCTGSQLRAEPAEGYVQAQWTVPFGPGRFAVPGGVLTVALCPPQACKKLAKDHKKGLNFAADYDKIYLNTQFRTRRAGDTFAPAGRGVHKPLRKWYSQEGVPPVLRATAPVLARGSRVLWAAPFGFCEGAGVSGHTKTAVVITWAANGGNRNE